MTKQKFIAVLLILLFQSLVFAQDSIPKENRVSYRKQLKNEAEFQIKQLHDGVLFVRLTTKKMQFRQFGQLGIIN